MHSYLSSTRALTPGHSIIHDSALPVTMQSSESAARIGHLAQMLLIFEAADGNRIELQGVIAMSASELATLSRKSMAPSPTAPSPRAELPSVCASSVVLSSEPELKSGLVLGRVIIVFARSFFALGSDMGGICLLLVAKALRAHSAFVSVHGSCVCLHVCQARFAVHSFSLSGTRALLGVVRRDFRRVCLLVCDA